MTLLRSLLARRDIWHRIAVERLTEPLHLNLLSLGVAAFGGLRRKILFDLVLRQQHAFGLLHAADQALARGVRRVTAVELGVGSGTGLLNLCEIARLVTAETSVEFDLVGFDTGRGMPPPTDHRDHPELYREGWFPMDRDRLTAALPPNARLILGDLATTIDEFASTLDASAPLGFATLDVDFYSSSKPALRLFEGPAPGYFPYVTLYVDDIAMPTSNRFGGELLAIDEFNAEHELRKIDVDRTLVYTRVFKHAEWLAHMYKVHVLDHAERNDATPPDQIVAVENPYLVR